MKMHMLIQHLNKLFAFCVIFVVSMSYA